MPRQFANGDEVLITWPNSPFYGWAGQLVARVPMINMPDKYWKVKLIVPGLVIPGVEVALPITIREGEFRNKTRIEGGPPEKGQE